MTIEEKSKLALKETRRSISKCQKVKYVGRWRGKDVFEDATEYPEGTVFIGPTGFTTVSDSGETESLSIYDLCEPDFPDYDGVMTYLMFRLRYAVFLCKRFLVRIFKLRQKKE